jgi:hypothetical protein
MQGKIAVLLGLQPDVGVFSQRRGVQAGIIDRQVQERARITTARVDDREAKGT